MHSASRLRGCVGLASALIRDSSFCRVNKYRHTHPSSHRSNYSSSSLETDTSSNIQQKSTTCLSLQTSFEVNGRTQVTFSVFSSLSVAILCKKPSLNSSGTGFTFMEIKEIEACQLRPLLFLSDGQLTGSPTSSQLSGI